MMSCNKISRRNTTFDQQWQCELAVFCIAIIESNRKRRAVVAATHDSVLGLFQANDIEVGLHPVDLLFEILTTHCPVVRMVVSNAMIKQNNRWNPFLSGHIEPAKLPVRRCAETIRLNQ